MEGTGSISHLSINNKPELYNEPFAFAAISVRGMKNGAEALELLKKEGPKYQYGKGCLSDGILGMWMATVCGLDEAVENNKVTSHLMFKGEVEKGLDIVGEPFMNVVYGSIDAQKVMVSGIEKHLMN